MPGGQAGTTASSQPQDGRHTGSKRLKDSTVPLHRALPTRPIWAYLTYPELLCLFVQERHSSAFLSLPRCVWQALIRLAVVVIF